MPVSQPPEQGSYLLAEHDTVSLRLVGEKATSSSIYLRRGTIPAHKGGGELIAKAVNHTAHPTVWDATAGLGRDSFVLASLGLTVTAFEQHPAVACLLSDGIRRALFNPETQDTAARINLHFGNAAEQMPALVKTQGKPDIVYLDPMYPERRKSAAVKKKWLISTGLSAKRKMRSSSFIPHAKRQKNASSSNARASANTLPDKPPPTNTPAKAPASTFTCPTERTRDNAHKTRHRKFAVLMQTRNRFLRFDCFG
ncbi:Ribosomal RNA small subunit methyltransferase J [Neisseria gonorrhoeae]|uniref:Ribosomal RNA small subunit methyltransferase J n=1 Tax=Neisseria gonorrhoeae TaxID=485 RepID=A0A378VVA3_NEIGO|nr:Ribosomal RNA small subunit methyltransferase J [Neisseria gonorrhoeae]